MPSVNDPLLKKLRKSDKVAIQEEGTTLDTAVTTINIVGSGATVSVVDHVATITITGGGGGSSHAPSYLMEDGTSYYLMEDGTSTYLLE